MSEPTSDGGAPFDTSLCESSSEQTWTDEEDLFRDCVQSLAEKEMEFE